MAHTHDLSLFPREIRELAFFFTCFANSDEAAEYVIKHDRGPGTFLLRPSTRAPGTLTLTVSINDNFARHVNVQQKADDCSPTKMRYFIIIERSFSSFHDLYSYYTTHSITNLEQIEDVRLLNPLIRPVDGAQVQEEVSLIPLNIDIPPLPRKKPTDEQKDEQGMPEVPSDRVAERSSLGLDSEGNEFRTSSSSNGSGPTGQMPIADSEDEGTLVGAVGGADISTVRHSQSGSQVGSPGAVSLQRTSVPSVPLPKDAIVVDFGNPEDLPSWPENGVDYLGPGQLSSPPMSPSTSVSLPYPAAMSKKEQKQLEKQEKKRLKEIEKRKQEEEKRRQKEEKQRRKEEERKKKNQKNMSELGWCRPPQPLPEPTVPVEDEPPYYTTPRPYRNHLEELKTMLRESEICDCGLRMMDAELADGWTVHRSREPATYLRVFYQHENGNTTWMFPQSITNLITLRQVKFILQLCREANIEEPPQLCMRLQAMQHPEGYYPQRSPPPGMHHAPSRTSVMSNRSRSSSNSSGQGPDPFGSSSSFNRLASLDQRLPMPRPGEGRPT